MSQPNNAAKAYIEIPSSDGASRVVSIQEFPFFIGRGRESGNHLSLDDMRISRKCAAISLGVSGFFIEDRGQRDGIFVNGRATMGRTLADGDRIGLGGDTVCQLVFRLHTDASLQEEGETKLRGLLDALGGDAADELKGLKLLLEASSMLHSQLPLESVLSAMLDHAIAITHADRGMLLEPDASGGLQVQIARGRNGENLAPESMSPSRSLLKSAIELESAVINEDLNLADLNVQAAQSVVAQLLRSSVVIPLFGKSRGPASSGQAAPRQLLGAVYLDSRRASTFSALDRQILDALGAQAASILDNSRLIEKERERQRLEQELNIAREIQQALVPQGMQHFPHLAVTGLHRPCYEVGGDYFDVYPLADGRVAILIADVAGKGLGAALLTTMLQGTLSGMSLGVDPVQVFSHLNRFLCQRAAVRRYATMFFGLLSPDGTLEFVRAGHPSPMLLRKGQVSELYTGGSFPVGLISLATFSSDRIQLEPEDTLVLFTDGVTEAEDRSHNPFGEERLTEAIRSHQDSSLDELMNGVLGAVGRFTEGARQFDDVTLLVVRYRSEESIRG
jgi:phosphoserine phosphatase RsbU/P